MKIVTERYQSQIEKLPLAGQHIIGQQNEKEIVVYQAYKPSIANFAVKNQFLGGAEYSYNRMSWIKPNFLWMMFRCGWGEKENQERVLAIWIDQEVFRNILSSAVFSSFDPQHYASHEIWKTELGTKEGRLQWDPDHDPFGNKITRRAIQLGLKGNLLEEFGKKKINLIEDITDFVKEQSQYVKNNQLDKLIVPVERIWEPGDILKKQVGVTD